MEHTSGVSSSSKVTVEYFDPHGVYPLISPSLLPRLPLRNLHWESHAGPLRSISSLHIDLVPSSQARRPLSTNDAAASSTSLPKLKHEDSGGDGFQTQSLGQVTADRGADVPTTGSTQAAGKERRHQIPGLRQTPYLKLLLLRCDDNDTYKAQSRKQVREWIKEQTPPTQSTAKLSAAENHDAFEWFILHVIVPNTSAATQPRTSGKSAEGASGTPVEKTGVRWRGGGSTTILEKLRADFNGSSKSGTDRIAQIRIGINDVPYDMLPRVIPAIPGSYTETRQENENAWLDVMIKFKSLILSSFDMRVSQYEEDIREKDAQRALPGWNFCTFFVLKEGLARGFESVGLVEDALVGYDELAVGLDAIVSDQSTAAAGAQPGGAFVAYTQDLQTQADLAKNAILKEMGAGIEGTEVEEPIDLQSTGKPLENEMDEIPLLETRKRYRELILSNDVSIFDFRCYIFARQLSLLLRLANASSTQAQLLAKLKEQRESNLQGVAARLPPEQPSEDGENLARLAEVCQRTMGFIASISRIMRDDIWAAYLGKGKSGLEDDKEGLQTPTRDAVLSKVVDNMVSSFIFSTAQQILAQTSTKALPIPPSTLAPPSEKMGFDGPEPKAAIPEPKTMMHPARSTSLAVRTKSRERAVSPGVFPSGRRLSQQDHAPASSSFLKTGLEELAAKRAELYLLSRNILEQAGKEHGWIIGWANIKGIPFEEMGDLEEIDLDGGSDESVINNAVTPAPSLHGVHSRLLRTALDNQDDFYRLYETLTDKAMRHFTVADHTYSVQSSMTDLAILKYHLKDYAAAASYLYRTAPFYGETGWTQMEIATLLIYVECLKELKRTEEYVRNLLKLLASISMIKRERLRNILPGSITKQDIPQTEEYVEQLLKISESLPHTVRVPLRDFFSRIEVDANPQYDSESDGFSLQIQFLSLLAGTISVEKARVKLSVLSGDRGREIWLENNEPILFENGSGKLQVRSNIITPDTYMISQIELYIGKVVLEFTNDIFNPPADQDAGVFRGSKILVYRPTEAFDVKLSASRYMHLDRNRSLEIELLPGWNNVIDGELHIRAATAGLRLQTSESKIVEGSLDISINKAAASVIRFGAMKSNSASKIRIPFNLEHDVNDISLKLEVSYGTEKGKYSFAINPSMSIVLPIGVNVQDFFKHKALFSRFMVSSASQSPLHLLRSTLEESDVFGAECGALITKPMLIFPRQPASMLYKLTKKKEVPRNAKKTLFLVLHYICLEEEIDNAVAQNLHELLSGSPLQSYARLVIPAVLGELMARLSSNDMERIAILSEIPLSVISDIAWKGHFSGLGRIADNSEDAATALTQKLEEWVQKTPVVPLLELALDEETIAASRSIVIPVDIPSVTVVHTADFKISEPSPVSPGSGIRACNQPIAASLTIKWTKIWNTDSIGVGGVSTKSEDQEFVYEVTGPADTWLIGGQRKGHFRVLGGAVEEGDAYKMSFPVILIPLREGYLPFPHVDIKPISTGISLRSGSVFDDGYTRAAQVSVTCETDYRNSGETIRVISDAKRTTVSLDASGPGGGAWLLESERRTKDAASASGAGLDDDDEQQWQLPESADGSSAEEREEDDEEEVEEAGSVPAVGSRENSLEGPSSSIAVSAA